LKAWRETRDKTTTILYQYAPVWSKEILPSVSNRAIGKALGADESTIRADLAGIPARFY
jgi:hypothetical protein